MNVFSKDKTSCCGINCSTVIGLGKAAGCKHKKPMDSDYSGVLYGGYISLCLYCYCGNFVRCHSLCGFKEIKQKVKWSYWNYTLLLWHFKIGLFGFGGGYAMLSLIQHEVVEVHNWISINDFTDIVAVQTTPGPIAFNSATYIGYTAVTDMGYTTFRSYWFRYLHFGGKYSLTRDNDHCMRLFARLNNNPWMRAALSVLKIAIIGLIAAAALMLMDENNFIDYKSLIIFAVVLVASIKKVDPILLIILSGLAGLILY